MKVVRIANSAESAMEEHIRSLFYDRDLKSSFYFNREYTDHYGKLVEKFENSIPHLLDEPLQEDKYAWFLRQCSIAENQDLSMINVHSLRFGGLTWSAFYLITQEELYRKYTIIHFSYH